MALWLDDFLSKVRAFIEYLESAVVADSAKLRLREIVHFWNDAEVRLTQIRSRHSPTMSFKLGFDELWLLDRYEADYDWVKSQLTASPPQGEPLKRTKQGRTPDEKREKSKKAIQEVLEENRQRVLNEEMELKEVADELILRKEPCWFPGGWKDSTAINLISSEMIKFRNSRNS